MSDIVSRKDITESPGFLINKIANSLNETLDVRLRAHNVTRAQWKMLVLLWEKEGRSQVEIQERLNLEGATVTGLIQRMLRQDLLVRLPDPVDKRVQRIFLTEYSRALEPVLMPIVAEVSNQVFQDFTADEKAFFTRLLLRMLNNIEGSKTVQSQ